MKRAQLIVALGLVGCRSEPTFAERVQACLDNTVQQNLTAYWVQGTWRLHGSGRRSGCVDPALDSDEVELGSTDIQVQQSGYSLALKPGMVSGFDLDGTVGARCVRFQTTEVIGTSQVHYDFPGEFVGTRTIQGEYTGDGPGTCHSEGEFTLTVVLDPLPPRPSPHDAGIRDAAVLDAPSPDAADADAEAPDGGTDAADAETDAPDGEVDAALDAGSVEDAPAEAPPPPGDDSGAAPEDDYTYVSWDFSASASAQAAGQGTSSCAVDVRSGSSSWLAPAALLLAVALRRRRNR